jgi:hypothetical protein
MPGKAEFGSIKNIKNINKNIIDLDIRCSGNITRQKSYRSEESNINLSKEVSLRTGYFDCSEITGKWDHVTLKLNTCSMVYKNFTFINCTFIEGSWLDSSTFKKCKFINCKIFGDIRWVDFLNCEFENVTFDLKYFRASKLDNKCTAKNLIFKIGQIDEYIWLFGKRYGSAPWGLDKPLIFNC